MWHDDDWISDPYLPNRQAVSMVSFNICGAYSLQNFISMNPRIHDLFSEEKPDQHLLCTAILFYIDVSLSSQFSDN